MHPKKVTFLTQSSGHWRSSCMQK